MTTSPYLGSVGTSASWRLLVLVVMVRCSGERHIPRSEMLIEFVIRQDGQSIKMNRGTPARDAESRTAPPLAFGLRGLLAFLATAGDQRRLISRCSNRV